MSDTSQVVTSGSAKRILRTAEEKRPIVEATLVPVASIARVARESGVSANQVFQWRYEYRTGAGWAKQPRPELLTVTIARESKTVDVAEIPSGVPSSSTGSIRIELPGRALVSVEGSVDPELSFKVIRHVRPKLSCTKCDVIVEAPAPTRPIERGLTGPALLAHVLGVEVFRLPSVVSSVGDLRSRRRRS